MTGRAGYSLVEVLIAFVIMTLVLSALIPGQAALLGRTTVLEDAFGFRHALGNRFDRKYLSWLASAHADHPRRSAERRDQYADCGFDDPGYDWTGIGHRRNDQGWAMNWRDRSGLSLMELLVALVLVAVIAGALASTTSFGVRLLDRTETLQEGSPEIALRGRLRHWLRSALPPTRLAGFPTAFIGTETKVQFTTLTPAPFAPDSAALRIIIDATTTDLTMIVEELDDDGAVLNTRSRILATDLQNGRISYFSDQPENPGWRVSWDDPARLPDLVQITGDEGGMPPWPEFTVKLSLAQ